MNIPLLQPYLYDWTSTSCMLRVSTLNHFSSHLLLFLFFFMTFIAFIAFMAFIAGMLMMTPAKAEEWLPANKPQRTYLLI
jgi:hypothetical protein